MVCTKLACKDKQLNLKVAFFNKSEIKAIEEKIVSNHDFYMIFCGGANYNDNDDNKNKIDWIQKTLIESDVKGVINLSTSWQSYGKINCHSNL